MSLKCIVLLIIPQLKPYPHPLYVFSTLASYPGLRTQDPCPLVILEVYPLDRNVESTQVLCGEYRVGKVVNETLQGLQHVITG